MEKRINCHYSESECLSSRAVHTEKGIQKEVLAYGSHLGFRKNVVCGIFCL
ncbi:MAG: hypothetical protein WCR45_05605 [Bacteroidaceae bacterium]|nr:hypothetical protein [Bacteroidaceae bacterium]